MPDVKGLSPPTNAALYRPMQRAHVGGSIHQFDADPTWLTSLVAFTINAGGLATKRSQLLALLVAKPSSILTISPRAAKYCRPFSPRHVRPPNAIREWHLGDSSAGRRRPTSSCGWSARATLYVAPSRTHSAQRHPGHVGQACVGVQAALSTAQSAQRQMAQTEAAQGA